MKEKLKMKMKTLLTVVAMTLLPPSVVISADKASVDLNVSPQNYIEAAPKNLINNIPPSMIMDHVEFFSNPWNRVAIMSPGDRSRYIYQNMSLIYPTIQIARAGKIVDLPYSIDNSIGDVTYIGEGKSISVNQHFENYPIDGMVVLKNGKIVYERYKTMGPNDKHIWFSVSKVIASTLFAMLEAEGKVDANQYVTHYVPELKGSVWDTVKVVEVLDMATGLNGTEHDEPKAKTNAVKANTKNSGPLWDEWTQSMGIFGGKARKWHEILKSMERHKPAYTAFEYNSINTFIIERIVENVAGRSFAQEFSNRIWGKLGMEHDGYMVATPTGLSTSFGFMNSSLRDLAKFGLMYTPSAKRIFGQQFLNQTQLNKIQSMQNAGIYKTGLVGKFASKNFNEEIIANRYQWDAVFPDGDIFKGGTGGQGLYVSPSKDIVVAWFYSGTGFEGSETMARAIAKKLQ